MNQPVIRYLRERPPALLVIITGLTAVTLLLTLIPSEYMTQSSLWSYDKLGHTLLFGTWTFLFGIYLTFNQPEISNSFIIFSSGVLFGGFIELLQYLLPINRNANWADLGFDAIGALLATLAIRFLFGPGEH